jgi:2-C-methyl-D-erythritol 2,4-cyclodiphosphate synthase
MMRIGIGVDCHPLVAGRKLILGGVQIPWEKGLGGHSDADVLSHALGDALLGSIGEGDLGKHFPDDDPAYEGISSQELLKEIMTMVSRKGYGIVNVDATVIAERPKLAPYVSRMKETLSSTLHMPAEAFSIKATTMEGMGFIGREEGIGVICVVLLAQTS